MRLPRSIRAAVPAKLWCTVLYCTASKRGVEMGASCDSTTVYVYLEQVTNSVMLRGGGGNDRVSLLEMVTPILFPRLQISQHRLNFQSIARMANHTPRFRLHRQAPLSFSATHIPPASLLCIASMACHAPPPRAPLSPRCPTAAPFLQ